MIIREAQPSDIDAVVALSSRFRNHSIYKNKVRENHDCVRELATTLIQSENSEVFVADEDGALVGMIAVIVYVDPITGDRSAGEVAWWVDEHRRGIGLRLLRQAERWAKSRHATTFQMIAPTRDVERIYEHRGYEPLERIYRLDLELR